MRFTCALMALMLTTSLRAADTVLVLAFARSMGEFGGKTGETSPVRSRILPHDVILASQTFSGLRPDQNQRQSPGTPASVPAWKRNCSPPASS